MALKKLPTSNPTLAEVKEQFKKWRRTRDSPHPIPTHLLEAAISLSSNYSIRQISEDLLVDYEDLTRVRPKKKKETKRVGPPTFIELEYEAPVALSECVVEMEDGSGAKMRMHFRGKTDFDLLELGRSFWRKRS